MNKAELGKKGEAVAARYYLDRGYRLLTHNYRTRMGEIDLILYHDDGVLVFSEVKTRSPGFLGTPAEAVDLAKQRRLIAAAKYYLLSSPYQESDIRFDAVEVIPQAGGYQVHCIQNAFTCND